MEEIFAVLSELRPEFDFRNSENFIEDGMLDSFDIVSLVTELENRYAIMIDALDILPENFSSVASIASIVRKSGGAL